MWAWLALVALAVLAARRVFAVAEGEVVRRHVERREPLAVELDEFARAVREGGPPPVDPREAMVALLLARTMVDAAGRGAAISGAELEAVLR